MAGHVITLALREKGYDVETLSARHSIDLDTYIIDVTDEQKFNEFLNRRHYDVVINCIGILIKQSDQRKDRATYINSFFPQHLAYRYRETDTRIIHLSTDCVFSGYNAPYAENSPLDGQSFYARSKGLGEVVNGKDLTFRMSIIGPEVQNSGISLFHWFMRQRSGIQGYTNVMWNGITTIQLAEGIAAAIEQRLSGLYHLVPSQNISKFNLLCLFREAFNRSHISIEPLAEPRTDKTLINTRSDFNFQVPTYPEMIEGMRHWIDSHRSLYTYQFY
jgi:dTDP-4-dehydrorhamnose reductase